MDKKQLDVTITDSFQSKFLKISYTMMKHIGIKGFTSGDYPLSPTLQEMVFDIEQYQISPTLK